MGAAAQWGYNDLIRQEENPGLVRSSRKSVPIRTGQRRFLGAAIPVVVLGLLVFALTLLVRLNAQHPVAIESPPVLSILNTLFMTLVSAVVAYLALRCYAVIGHLNILLLGTAVLPSGLGALIAGLALNIHGGTNVAITSHNLGMFFSALIHFTGALLINLRLHHLFRMRNRRLAVWAAYLAASLLVLATYLASRRGLLPVFFIRGVGGTQLRQIILAASMVLYLTAALLLLARSRGGKSPFLFWYALALFAACLGLLPISLERVTGGILSWFGRGLQYMSGIYFLVAVWSSARTARSKGVPLEKSIADLFQEYEDFFRDLLDTLSDAVVAVDDSGRVILWNKAAVSLFGYSRGAALGSPIAKLFAAEEAGEGGRIWQADSLDSVPIELTMQRKSGQRFPAELTRSARNTAVGKIVTLIIRDVSERRRHQILQLEQYQLLESVLGQAPDAIVVYDTQGKLLFLNRAARKLGFDDSADSDWLAVFRPVWLRGRTARNGKGLPPQASPRPAADRFRTALYGSVVDVFEVQGRRDGKTVELLVSAAPLRDPEGNTIGATAVLSEVSRLKQMEERLRSRARKLRQLNAELAEFTYVSSHDLKEPLRTLASYLQILSNDYHDHLDEEGERIIEAALSQARRMRRLIDDLLRYARVGKDEQSAGRTAVKAVLDQVLLGFREQLEETGGRVESGELPEVCVDPTELTQLLQNLISNSFKYRGSEPPFIRVGCEPPEDGMVRISVADNGIGIEQRHQERIFRAFQRLHSRNRYEGTGIGLAICKKVVEGYGGRIWVKSEPGSGSTFTFTLPA
jgi:PAS domain S-box-containing protein